MTIVPVILLSPGDVTVTTGEVTANTFTNRYRKSIFHSFTCWLYMLLLVLIEYDFEQ